MPKLRNHVGMVIGVRAKLQVVGIHASGIVASVHDDNTGSDRAFEQLVSNSVGAHSTLASTHSNEAIASAVQVAHPGYAAIGVDFTASLKESFLQGLRSNLGSMTRVRAKVIGALVGWKNGASGPAVFARNLAGLRAGPVVALSRAEASMAGVASILKSLKRLTASLTTVFRLSFESRGRTCNRAELPLATIDVREPRVDTRPTCFALPLKHCGHDVHSIKDKRVASFYPCEYVQASKVKANISAIENQAGRKISYLAPYPPDLAKAGGLR